jgi:hypothetical protein
LLVQTEVVEVLLKFLAATLLLLVEVLSSPLMVGL